MTDESPLSRRTMIKAAAWSVPVVAAAVATPLAAASDDPPAPAPDFDLSGTTGNFSPNANFTSANGNITGYYGVGFVRWDVTISNAGPDAIAAGSLVQFGLGMGPYFDSFEVVNNGGLALSSSSTRTQEAISYGGDNYFRSFWRFTITQSIPAGASFSLRVKARLRRQPINGYSLVQTGTNVDWKGYNIQTFLRLTQAGGGDRDSANNNAQSGTNNTVIVHANSYATATAVPNSRYVELPQS